MQRGGVCIWLIPLNSPAPDVATAPAAMPPFRSLIEGALAVLGEPDPWKKADACDSLVAAWQSGRIDAVWHGESAPPPPPGKPARDARVQLLAPGEMPKRGKGGTLASRQVGYRWGMASAVKGVCTIQKAGWRTLTLPPTPTPFQPAQRVSHAPHPSCKRAAINAATQQPAASAIPWPPPLPPHVADHPACPGTH